MSKEPAKPYRITGTLKTALDLMVYGNEAGAPLEYDEAAKAAGMTVRAMRMALDKAHVGLYLRQQRAIRLASLGATNLHHLATLRGASSNQMVRLGAARTIEDLAGNGEPVTGARPRQPGIVINIVAPTPAPALAAPTMTLIGSPIEQPTE